MICALASAMHSASSSCVRASSLEARVSTREAFMLRQQGQHLVVHAAAHHIGHDVHSILCCKAIQQPACRHRDRLGLIPQGSKGIKIRQLAKDHLHGVLHSGGQPSVRSKNDSVHTHPRPFLCFLHLFGVCIILFVIDVIIVMYIVPHFAQTSRGFSKKIFTLVKCTKHFPYILAVSPITFRRTTKRASFPGGKDAFWGTEFCP